MPKTPLYYLARRGLHVGQVIRKDLLDAIERTSPAAFATWEEVCVADGRRLAITQYHDLYMQLGENYGPVHDGTFVIPNLVERSGAKPLMAYDTTE